MSQSSLTDDDHVERDEQPERDIAAVVDDPDLDLDTYQWWPFTDRRPWPDSPWAPGPQSGLPGAEG
ncbi:hypothetical protein [Frankia sp. AgW1.1]|uniref:hypothetical protein n=1 Tax=Frankia sp. AgW1.1 TaxID=1836971 RepID=UPI0019315E90|nr:hypothetical protein [Frankia sp. AgW1.1]MBL7494384.1 hypothetical protein [Frankia sp. AgW1.1]